MTNLAPTPHDLLLPSLDSVLLLCNAGIGRPGEVHDLRVSVGRLRVALWVFRDQVGRSRRRKLDSQLRWLRHRLGPVREWDVLHDELLGSASPETPEAQIVDDEVARLRRRALRDGRQALAGHRVERLRTRLLAVRHRLIREPGETPDARALVQVARVALDRRMAGVAARVSNLDSGDEQAPHALRKQVRKLRYAAELLAPLFSEPAAGPFVAGLKGLQDRLGAAHDTLVHQQHLAELSDEARASALALAAQKTPAPQAQPGDPVPADDLRELALLRPFWVDPQE